MAAKCYIALQPRQLQQGPRCKPCLQKIVGMCRFLVSVEADDLPVTVVLNKADLVAPEECQGAVAEVRARSPTM